MKESKLKTLSIGAGKVIAHLANEQDVEIFENLQGKDLSNYKLQIIKISKPKSLDMNRYMWQLCSKIADEKYRKEHVSYTKDEIYREAVRQVGISTDMVMPNIAVDRFMETWGVIDGKKHIGYFCETVRREEFYTTLRCYYGSSSYDADELRRLTDWVVEEAKAENIETATPAELAELENLWRLENGRR